MPVLPSTPTPTPKRLGFFSRVLDDTTAARRYQLATDQIVHAEQHGYDTAWVAQHHFHAREGGLPAPLVFLAHVAARTQRIRLGTGIVTLPMENPVRVAEDAAVLDLLAQGRLEVGVGTGGTPASFAAFGLDFADRADIFARHLALMRSAWAGEALPGGDVLYPTAPQLPKRLWQATFSTSGATRAGLAGDGLMLSRTQPRTDDQPHATLPDIQHPIIDAYLEALPAGHAPRILGSRSVFVADSRDEALHWAGLGLRQHAAWLVSQGKPPRSLALADLIAASDTHVGTVQDVIDSLSVDTALARTTDFVVQVHSVDPPHELILRSIELVAQAVAPALGWRGPAIG